VNTQASTYFKHILQQYRAQKAKDRLKHAALLCFIVNGIYLMLGIGAESLWYMPPDVKQVFWSLFLLNIIFLIGFILILRDVFFRHSEKDNADLLLRIGRQYQGIDDRLLNHYQLSLQDDPLSVYAVDIFIRHHPVQTFDTAFRPRKATLKRNAAFIIVFLLTAVSLLLFSGLRRLAHPQKAYEPHSSYNISFIPGDTTIYAYDSLDVFIRREAPEHIPLRFYLLDENEKQPGMLTRVSDSLYYYRLERVRESLTCFAALRRPHLFYPRQYFATDTLRVRVLERPRIRTLDFTVKPPEYAALPETRFQGDVDRIRCLRGSRIEIDAVLSEPAGPSYMVFEGDTLEMERKEHSIYLSFLPDQSGLLSFMFYNRDTIGIREPLTYVLKLQEDAYPNLSIVRPGRGDEIILNEDLTLPLMAHIRDDFGFSAFRVRYEVHSDYSSADGTVTYTHDIPFSQDARIQTLVNTWRIDRFISPGSSVVYYFELFDNDMVSGPKAVRSSHYYARFPTLGDLFAKQFEEQKNTSDMLEKELLSQQEMLRDIEQVRHELLMKGEMDWDNKTTLEESIDALERSREQLEQMQEAMEQQKQFMQENMLFSDQVMQTFEQLQQLMNELIDDEMFELMENIRDKLEKNDMSGMEEMLRDFEELAKRFEQVLERMLEVFKRVQQEQRLEELARRIKEELRQQEALVEQEETLNSGDLAARQEKIRQESEKTQSLSRESAELFSDQEKAAFESFLDEMEAMDLLQDMEDAVSAYLQELRSSGLQESRDAAEKLSDVNRKFSEMASSIKQQRWEEIAASFRAIFQKVLYISTGQEKLNAFGKDIDAGSPFLHEFTSGVNNVIAIAVDINNRLAVLAGKTFLVDQALGIVSGQVIAHLQTGLSRIEDANIAQGKRDLQNAHVTMNRLGRMILERMHYVSQQQGSASGMEFYLEQLQQMAGQQQALNESMPLPGPGGAPGESMMQQLAEMAARQQALRRALKEIEKGIQQGDGGRRIPGDLDRIAKDMEEVINQMRQNQVDRRTIMRQEQIVQRLLDASRSATSRDFREERESRTAEQIRRPSPLGLPEDLGERESLINALRRAVLESDLSPRDKRDMERYLESLQGQDALPRIRKEGER
jgi:hypothetical protein